VTTVLAAPGTSPQAPEQAAPSLPGCLPARAAAADWPATRLGRGPAREQLTRPPFTREVASSQETRARGLARLLDWLADQPGATWQERWLASGAEEAGAGWAQLPIRWLHDRGRRSQWLRTELATALGAVICADLIRPSVSWLVSGLAGKGALGRDLARARDPAGFARMRELCDGDPGISKAAADMALRRATLILAAKGGTIADITVGDVLEILGTETSARSAAANGAVFHRLLHQMGTFGEEAPARLRELRTPGQLTPAGLIDRCNLACRPVRDLLVDYLRERQPALDYTSLKALAYHLGKRFWQDLEHHHPGTGSLNLPREVADAWKQRQRVMPKTITTAAGEKAVIEAERTSYRQGLTIVRAFYLDLSQWAARILAAGRSGRLPAPSARKRSACTSSRAAARRAWTRAPANGCRSSRSWCAPSTNGARQPRHCWKPHGRPCPGPSSPPRDRPWPAHPARPAPGKSGPTTRPAASGGTSDWKTITPSGHGLPSKSCGSRASGSRNSWRSATTA